MQYSQDYWEIGGDMEVRIRKEGWETVVLSVMASRGVTGSRPSSFLECPSGILLVNKYPKTYKSKELGKERETIVLCASYGSQRGDWVLTLRLGRSQPGCILLVNNNTRDIGVRIRKGERVTVILCDSCGSQRGDWVSTFRLGRSQPECILLVNNGTGDIRLMIRKEWWEAPILAFRGATGSRPLGEGGVHPGVLSSLVYSNHW